MSKIEEFERFLYNTGSWAIYFAEAPIDRTTQAYRELTGERMTEGVEIHGDRSMKFFPRGCNIQVKNSDWTIVLHRIGQWVNFDAEAFAKKLNSRVVEFAGEDTSGHVESSLIEPDGNRVRYQTNEDASYEDDLYDEIMEYMEEDQSPPKLAEAEKVDSYSAFFKSLGIVPLLVTVDKQQRVLVDPDDVEKIVRVDLADHPDLAKA